MKFMDAGRPPRGGKVGIVKVESLDEDGVPFDPPEFEYWVVVLGGQNPKVFSTKHPSYQDALDWLLENGMELGVSPP